jgi:hypothetical protein
MPVAVRVDCQANVMDLPRVKHTFKTLYPDLVIGNCICASQQLLELVEEVIRRLRLVKEDILLQQFRFFFLMKLYPGCWQSCREDLYR